MAIRKVVVFGATGFQGRAQLLELLRQGYEVRAVARNPGALSDKEFEGVECVAADYDNPQSLARALDGCDAVFFQAPALGDNARLLRQCAALVEAIRTSPVQLTVVNSSMWAPNEPCGEIIYDGVLAMEEVFTRSGLPVIIFRPTLFMNNLLGDWVRSSIVDQAMYYYPHKADLASDWISLEDVARFMVTALDHPELAGRKLRIGGPERLTTLQMLAIMSEVLGHDIQYKFMTPVEFGAFFWDYYGAGSGLDRDTYIAGWDSFYTFNNDAPQRPFQADSSEALAVLPVERVTLRDWAMKKKWR